MGTILWRLLISAFFLLSSTSAYATLTSMTNAGGEIAVFDNVNDQYWYFAPGDFDQYEGTYIGLGGPDPFASGQISWMNTRTYFGINNWHLATEFEWNDMITESGAYAITQAFLPTYSTPGSQTVQTGGLPGLCMPPFVTIGCGSSTTVDYTDIHFAGALADTRVVDWVILDKLQRLYADVVARDYEANNVGLNDRVLSSSEWIDDRFMSTTYRINGAWVVGSMAGGPVGVPEPSMIFLIGTGLAGILCFKNRKR